VRTGLSVGVVGLGEWGRLVARTLAALPRAELRWLCDRDPKVPLSSRDRHPTARTTVDLDDLLNDERLDAVVVATPSPFRAEVARRALDADKHVLVREPIARAAGEADDLVARAERRHRHLAAADGLVHDLAVRALGRLLERGELGEVYYLSVRRQQPGGDGADVLWDVGAGDVSLVLALLRDTPVDVSGASECYVEAGRRELVCCHLRFATGIVAHLQLSTLGQRRVREVSAEGSRRTAVVDASGGCGELSVWAGPADALDALGQAPELGTVVTPRFTRAPPLRLDCEAFLEALRTCDETLADARRAAATVNVLEALDESDSAAAPPVSESPTGAELAYLPGVSAPALVRRRQPC
jgi:predicted dehydrogenase